MSLGACLPSCSDVLANADVVHASCCVRRFCCRCKWLKRRESYEALCRIGDGCLGSWLAASICERSGEWGVGCWVCQKHGDVQEEAAWAHMRVTSCMLLKPYFLHRHADSTGHKRALAAVFPSMNFKVESHSVSIEEFKLVLDDRLKGTSLRTRVDCAARTKNTCMQWCLAEAARGLDRKFLRGAQSIALQIDARAPRLAVRFRACDAQLKSRTGQLGHAKDFGTRAINVQKALHSVIERFCTLGNEVPVAEPRTGPVLDEELMNHIIDRVELLDSDRASEEQVALHDARSLFKNTVSVMWDKTHASRRPTHMHRVI